MASTFPFGPDTGMMTDAFRFSTDPSQKMLWRSGTPTSSRMRRWIQAVSSRASHASGNASTNEPNSKAVKPMHAPTTTSAKRQTPQPPADPRTPPPPPAAAVAAASSVEALEAEPEPEEAKVNKRQMRRLALVRKRLANDDIYLLKRSKANKNFSSVETSKL